jgi:hypothetical protein
VFAVREFDASGQFIASAFFPNDPRNRRRVLIDPSFFAANLSFDRIGVLRHELGHVLGFRHEHIRSGAPPACPDEDVFGAIDLTRYDPQSVMHYFCGGLGTRELRITAIDRNGSRQVYGPPARQPATRRGVNGAAPPARVERRPCPSTPGAPRAPGRGKQTGDAHAAPGGKPSRRPTPPRTGTLPQAGA